MKSAWTFVWHFLVVLLLLAVVAAGIGLSAGAEFHFGADENAYRAEAEGPHVFQQDGQWVAQVLRGNRDTGFSVEETRHALSDSFRVNVAFPLEQSHFSVQAVPDFVTPPVRYETSAPVLAISDIEGNFKAFRDFLLHSRVIDAELKWRFGNGHLVLLGDFVDRGPSVTQVLWLIYKLEQEAVRVGGRVHYIMGNHEIKNLQGDLQAMHPKYVAVSSILGRQRLGLLGDDAFLGRWLASKNSVELINGIAFVHGGLHPALADRALSLEDMNRIVRDNYRRVWYPGIAKGDVDLLISPKTGPAWYRGYFKDDLSQAQVEQTLARFNASAVIVGHTLNWRVKSMFEGKVFAIDVKHPWDHRNSIPFRRSEGLWLEAGQTWRVRDDGSRVALRAR